MATNEGDVQVVRHGLTFKRFFTKDGVHPYDEIEWERRDALIPNYKEGGNAFEQRDVEFPKAWSQNATNIVAQKYFRGPLGTPQRESSVRQLVGRVVDTIAGWGRKDGYFAGDQDAQVFAEELTHLLVNQKAAFNSPVWFNVGVPDTPQQCSACQPYDSLVSTPGGLVSIGELVARNAVGEKVYDAHGVTRIVATKSNGVKDVLRIHTKSGHSLDVTADHLVWRASDRHTGRFVEAGQLRPDDRLEWHRREAFGEGDIDLREIAEAALAGWLQSDGFVGRYEGTNRSITIEAMTVNDAELEWVTDALDRVFPDVHRHERRVETQDGALDCRRIRLYGNGLQAFIDRWDLMKRGTTMRVPDRLFTAPLPIVAAYLRSLFQAEGYVSVQRSSARVGFDMISEDLVRGVQQLLGRFGIFCRVRFKGDARPDRKGCFSLSINSVGDQVTFAEEIGFLDPRKTDRLEMALDRIGIATRETKQLEIQYIEDRGPMEVYDIQTESGEYLSGNLRVHNCFILAVEDEMSSILNWYVEEGTIFKGGSGSGINLSKIRSSKEPLAGGGTASGPVSFMRGADASAGTIKSGGKTRRAAKMVILNVDHPDVHDFIACKAVEERKARALRDAGFDMDLDGKDAYSIQYQNANNSVRVTDEFMKAYEQDQDWKLKAVLTGETVETVRARELMREIAQAAWECADPGMQYDTTINEWHTCPATGRINASNPCSEYMHLDNSACNLASLNLLKFLDAEGSFDVKAFRRAVDVVFTAQEIIVGNADYPTEKIGENARAFRQLGLGYANLGALLMARGLAYDSDGGRAWAGAITALMTGQAYRSSARIAEVMGPFAGYEPNTDAMLRVMRKHRAAADEIDGDLVPEALLSAAKQSWDDAIAFGQKHGYRNAQASVLAPTGTIGLMLDCDTTGIEPELALVKTKKLVGGGTMQFVNQTVPRALERLGYAPAEIEDVVAYIAEHNSVAEAPHLKEEHHPVFHTAMGDQPIHYMGHVRMMAAAQSFISGAISKCVTAETVLTTEDGLIRIGRLYEDEAPDSFRDLRMAVASLDGIKKTDAFYYGGSRQVREVILRSGHRVVGTENHQLLVAGEEGLAWRRLDEVRPGDRVAVRYGAEMWAMLPATFGGFMPSERYGSQKAVRVPIEMTEELAFLLGAFVSEGHISRPNWTVTITNAEDRVLERVARAWRSEFGVEPRIVREPSKCPGVLVSSKTIVEFLEWLGCGARASAKRIPDTVLRSPRSMVLAFLQGLALDAYVAWMGRSPKWAICVDSPGLLDDLQAVLTNFGVVHSRILKLNRKNGKTYGEVYACGEQAQRLIQLVGFLEPHKRQRAEAMLEVETGRTAADVVPGIAPRDLYELIPRGKSGRNGTGYRKDFAFLCDTRTGHVSRRTLERVAQIPGVEIPPWLDSVLRDELHFSPVERVADAGERNVFDISVPETQAFVGNGIVNHNTVNMPEPVTVEEVEQLFVESWKLGLKAVAIYRDNCKVAQPLSADKKKVRAVPEPAELGHPVRKRLPQSRPSLTTKFEIADAEGYITASSYPDDGIGEIFLKTSKQGSTLSGITDAFSIAISIGLQYGVPLETFVEKFINMKFEPSGMTNDPDVRFASSIVDYVFRRLALDHLPKEKREALGIRSIEERKDHASTELNGGTYAPKVDPPSPKTIEGTERPLAQAADAPLCYSCGSKMQPAGSCYLCPSCGSTSGCS